MALTTPGDILAAELNTEFDGIETELQEVLDAAGTHDYSEGFTVDDQDGTQVDYYFYAPDDAQVVGMYAHSYENSAITGEWKFQLVGADIDDLLGQGTGPSISISYSGVPGAKTASASYLSEPYYWLRKGARYKVSLTRTSGAGPVDWMSFRLALRLKPRRV